MITDNNKEALKEYFKTRKDVAFAFLFGSQARGTATVSASAIRGMPLAINDWGLYLV